ncbi:LIM/homeobox protein Lhx2-like [Paramacrobiotus metropolitanus]|uniref:LIM/homeobox protein Lhx2-like n=1 Tax=Paramacrobiotus metropolitanus TaxID=2943436 RepID=UPI002446394F|nr:LIM/homeobox protein Lhx2-like [Paramacrobiotus metropolitanus]
MHVGPAFCAGCSGAILDRYFLSTAAAATAPQRDGPAQPTQVWHCQCLKCALCGVNLDAGREEHDGENGGAEQRTVCFYKDGQLLCRDDYLRRYREAQCRCCTICQRAISSNELVMKIRDGKWVYHLDCFRCGVCGQLLRTGDQFVLREDGHVVCRLHHHLSHHPSPGHVHPAQPLQHQPVPVIHYADSTADLSHAPLEHYAAHLAMQRADPLDLQVLREMAISRAVPMHDAIHSPKPTYMSLGEPESKAADSTAYHLPEKKRTRNRAAPGRRRRSSAASHFDMLTEADHPPQVATHVQPPFVTRDVRRPRRSSSVASSGSTELSPPCGEDDADCSPPAMNLGYLRNGMALPGMQRSHSAQRDSSSPNSTTGGPQSVGTGQRTKRMRTSFKHQQLRTMKQYFGINHNPDAKDLKQLAQKTGLTKRVLQVWFQNARAKYRRSLLKQDGGSGGSTALTNGCPGDESPHAHSEGGTLPSLSPDSLMHADHPGSPGSGSMMTAGDLGRYQPAAVAKAGVHYY